MDIFCPACQKKLQIADSAAGQAVKCPYCAATFAAPALPSATPLPPPEPLAPLTPQTPPGNAPFSFAQEDVRLTPQPAHAPPPLPDTVPPPSVRQGDYTRDFTINLRRPVVTLIAPLGMILLFILSFFPWRFTELTITNPAIALTPATAVDTITTLNPLVANNLWILAFTREGSVAFTFYVLLMIVAALLLLATTILAKNQMLTPANLRPFLPWAPTFVAFFTLAAWLFFLAHYLHCILIDPLDPATLWMKLAFRIHTLVVIAAWLDVWLERRHLRQLPEPQVRMHW